MDWDHYGAALFDLDGVVTPTAEVHMRAWSALFNEYVTALPNEQAPYTDDDYFRYVDGKPRYDGVRAFLASRDIALPEGGGSDESDLNTVTGLGNRKDAMFNDILERDGVAAYPGSVALLDHLATRNVVLAVVSSSRNAPKVLRAAGLADRFAFVVDGALAEREGLPGKPAPDTFSYAAHRAGVSNAQAVVLEDAVSGVRAGASGAFGLVVGVDRGAGADSLRAAGAHLVVRDLEELVP